MGLPTPEYPGALWDGNEQSTANDIPGDDTRANGADHNEIAAEVVAIEDDLRKAATAVGEANIEDALTNLGTTSIVQQVRGVAVIGALTIAQINALAPSPVEGINVIAASAGTPSAGSSDTLAIGDIAEFNGTDWKTTVANVGGFPPADTVLCVAGSLLGYTLTSPFSPGDEGKIGTWDGASATPASLVTPTPGQLVSGSDPGVVGLIIGNLFSFVVADGGITAWRPVGHTIGMLGPGLEEVGVGQSRVVVDDVTIKINGSNSLALKAVPELALAEIAVADASGGATGAALTLDLKDQEGSALGRDAVAMILASTSQFGGQRNANANITLGTVTKGTVLEAGAASGWWVVKTDSNGEFDCTATNAVDETVYFSVVTAEGVDGAGRGALVYECVPDAATWS
jgi:hypothetical protein